MDANGTDIFVKVPGNPPIDEFPKFESFSKKFQNLLSGNFRYDILEDSNN